MVREGVRYYFRVLLPWLVILFILLLVFALIMIVTLISTGGSTDYEGTGLIAVFVMIPTLFLTFFCDTAAVFEDLRVFASLRRSIGVVPATRGKCWDFLLPVSCSRFLTSSCLPSSGKGSSLTNSSRSWTITTVSAYNETQFASMFTPQQLVTMIGPDGMWITAAVIFLAVVFLVPLLLAFKACFYRSMIGSPVATVQQMTGEFDSKGRWYKY